MGGLRNLDGTRRPGRCRVPWPALLGLLLAALGGASADAAEWGQWSPYPQFPGLFRERCGGCHGEAGDFAPAHLTLGQGALRARRSGKALEDFLPRHPGRLDAVERADLIATLATIVTAGGQFRQRCAVCHGHAERFARSHLVIRDGRLRGRDSGRDIEAFLPGHGRLDAEGAAFFNTVLRRFAQKETQP